MKLWLKPKNAIEAWGEIALLEQVDAKSLQIARIKARMAWTNLQIAGYDARYAARTLADVMLTRLRRAFLRRFL